MAEQAGRVIWPQCLPETDDVGLLYLTVPGKDGLLYISQVCVNVVETDERGRLKLSIKAADPVEGAQYSMS